MGDQFVLLIDRLLTESTLEAVIERNNQLQQATSSSSKDDLISSHNMDLEKNSSPTKLVQCRICHDEDDDANMETPCSCCGSLKYAHRKCVQRWCNEKGDTICEICLQQFKPDYTAPSPLFHYGGIPMNFRGNWEISRRDLHNSQFVAMVAPDHEFLDTDFAEYSTPSTRSLMCCRVVAIIFMILLVLRHTLPIVISGAGKYSLTLFVLLMLRTIGILLPIYIMVKAFTAIQRRRPHQVLHSSPTSSDEENDLTEPQSRVIHIL
ncbi:RING/FYVE/PHD zinc finger superfamily protein [Quillaja saponaria]|uniref:RING/FYVE/PHD zinc finger superfamily protein n=1 Tax=Quillaja saponaria TaxID=32244 RepID=A0AAD7Q6M2_QUISA|nr:RING/FYVE/PHD zinc finger superfamily protein [Quillaja saponaria]